MLKYTAWFLSALLHIALALPFVTFEGGEALQSGTGEDRFFVEQGIVLEGIDTLGQDEATVEEIETPQTQLSEARPEIDEVEAKEAVEEPPPPDIEAAELPEDTEVIQSKEGPEQEAVRPKEPERKELEEPRPKQIATLELPEEIAVKEEQSSGPKQTGGDVTLLSAYRGKLRTHLGRNKVNPRSRLTGTVVVRFTVGTSGELLSREVTQSSGHRALDEAAVASLDRAAPFPPFSEGMDRQPMVVSVPFRFVTR